MYQLLVFYGDDPAPRARVTVARAADVLARIPALMTEHDGCEHVIVYFNEMRLFGIDCAGNAVP